MVFPLPVSPITTKIRLSKIALSNSVLRVKIGKLSLCSLKLKSFLAMPDYAGATLLDYAMLSFLQSGKSNGLPGVTVVVPLLFMFLRL